MKTRHILLIPFLLAVSAACTRTPQPAVDTTIVKPYPAPHVDTLRADSTHSTKIDTVTEAEPRGEARGALATTSRPYHALQLRDVAQGRFAWTHIEIRGSVAYVRSEPDGDTHIKLTEPLEPATFVICECTPKEPCTRPRAGADIIVQGISRRDPEHGWYEVHPVEHWAYATAGK